MIGVEGLNDLWVAFGRRLYRAFLCLVGISQHLPEPIDVALDSAHLRTWIQSGSGSGDPLIASLLARGLSTTCTPHVVEMAVEASSILSAFEALDDLMRDSVYATASLMLPRNRLTARTPPRHPVVTDRTNPTT